MIDTVTIPLKIAMDGPDRVVLESVQWWSEGSRFVVVKYSIKDHLEDYGMRIDLDKRAFLDHFDDAVLDQQLESLLPKICSVVYETKLRSNRTDGYATLTA